MMRLLDDALIDQRLLSGKEKMTFKKIMGLAQKFYQFGDDFWKIIGFENEKRFLIEAGYSEAEAEVEAAERIRNTYPTYSMVGKAVNMLRRFPLAGTFVSFPAEIIRTSYHIMRYTAKDWQNPGMRKAAARRTVGITVAAGLAYAIQEMSKQLLDVGDDDEEAVRLLAPPWQRNSNLTFLGRDDKEQLVYVDTSYVDPYNYWKRPLTAIFRDQPWTDKLTESARELFSPFFGADIAARVIFELMSNKKGSGAPVFKEHDLPHRQLGDILNHLRKTLQPGLFANIERSAKALNEEVTSSGRRYETDKEALAWVGWRVSTFDPKVSIYYRTFDF